MQETILDTLGHFGYKTLAKDSITELTPGSSYLLAPQLRAAIDKLNPKADVLLREEAFRAVMAIAQLPLPQANYEFHRLLQQGVSCAYQDEGYEIGGTIRILDERKPHNNSFEIFAEPAIGLASLYNKRDILLYVNGLPLVIIRLAKDGLLSRQSAHEVFADYINFPKLIAYNCLGVSANGDKLLLGCPFSQNQQLLVWQNPGNKQAPAAEILSPKMLCDYIANFVSVSRIAESAADTHKSGSKEAAFYYQYYAVTRAVAATAKAMKGDKRAGVIWHTYGSKMINAMLFYAGKLLRVMKEAKPVLLFVFKDADAKDRFYQFMLENRDFLDREAICAETHSDLRQSLNETQGGIILTTIQKFYSEAPPGKTVLSPRDNIVVIFRGSDTPRYGSAVDRERGEASDFRSRFLPNATLICFSNYPKRDDDAGNLCGDYLSIYDMNQALADEAVNQIYYESPLPHLQLSPKLPTEDGLDRAAMPASVRGKELEQQATAKPRIAELAKYILDSFEAKHSITGGKALVVASSRYAAVKLYEAIINLRPGAAGDNQFNGKIKLVMTSASDDPAAWDKYKTSQEDRATLRSRFSNPNDELGLCIVVDMWLAGFYDSSLHTLYWDKLMRGNDLLRAVCQVNSSGRNKPAGLLVDFMGIDKHLKDAIKSYINTGEETMPIIGMQEGVVAMERKYAKIKEHLKGIDYSSYHKKSDKAKLAIISQARNHIFQRHDTCEKFVNMLDDFSGAYVMLLATKEARSMKQEVIFLHTLRECLLHLNVHHYRIFAKELNLFAARDIVKLDSSGLYGVNDINKIGAKDVNQGLLANLEKIQEEKIRLLALNKLAFILLNMVRKRDLLYGDKFLARFKERAAGERAKRYNKLAELVTEIIGYYTLKKKLRVNNEVYAMYNLLREFKAAANTMPDKQLLRLAEILLREIKRQATADWEMMEHARALLRVAVKRNLRRHGYLARSEQQLVNAALEQAEIMSLGN